MCSVPGDRMPLARAKLIGPRQVEFNPVGPFCLNLLTWRLKVHYPFLLQECDQKIVSEYSTDITNHSNVPPKMVPNGLQVHRNIALNLQELRERTLLNR